MDTAASRAGDSGRNRNKKRPKISVWRIVGRVFLVIFTLGVIGVLTTAIFFRIFLAYVNTVVVPTVNVTVEELTMSQASTIYYKDKATGEWKVYDRLHSQQGNRKIVSYDELPEHLKDALIAIEDKRFYSHQGVDWLGTSAAFVKTFTTGSTRGGSTITQQVLRTITQDNDVIVKRKIREIFRALEFEKNHSKADILTLYFNYVYFGAGCDGVGMAAEVYFGKEVSELDLAESASLVAIVNNPSLYDPFYKKDFKQEDGSVKTPRDFNKKRQELILDEMCDQGKISEAECTAAKAEKLLFTDTPEYAALHADDQDLTDASSGSYASWFTDALIEDAIALIMEARNCDETMALDLLYNAGYHIYSTIDLDIQRIVDSVYTDLSNFDFPSKQGTQMDSAITIVDPYTGDVVAMAGGVGEKAGSRLLNLATSPRKCGSSIKPLSVYSPAIDSNIVSPASIIDDYPAKLNDAGERGYPKNDPDMYRGLVTVSYGVNQSINTVAYRTLSMLGTAVSFEFLEKNLGITTLDLQDNDLAPLGLGGLTYGVTTEEMAAAYGAFANEGIYTRPRTITEIRGADNEEVIVDNGSHSVPAMKESTAYLMNKILQGAVKNGTGTEAYFEGMAVAGKTGTTQSNFDRYFTGYTPYYSAAVWVGYSQRDERIVTKNGVRNPAAVTWRKVMEKVHEGLEERSFPAKPAGIVSVQVCADCGLRPVDLCSQDARGSRVISLEVQEGAVPSEYCACHVEARLCTDPETGEVHLANQYCPDETCETRVMIQGRQFLFTEGGSIITSKDSDSHLTYLQWKGECTYHNAENSPILPPGEEGEPLPGDPGWQWTDDPWTGPTTEPDAPDEPVPPGGTEGDGQGGTTTPEPGTATPEPDGPDPGTTEPEEPDEPVLPPEE